MKSKIISLGIVSCFLLIGLFGISAVGMKVEATEGLPDFSIERIYKDPWITTPSVFKLAATGII